MKQVFIILMMLPLMTMAQMTDGLLTLSEITVKQGHNAQFMEGVKKWKECYNKEEGKDSWAFWSRVQGEGNVYGISGDMPNWAEMDNEDMASKSCRMIVMNFITPHIEKVNYNITKKLPAWSRKSKKTDTKIVWITYFRVKNDVLFTELIKEITETIISEEGEPRGNWYGFMGGSEDAPNYMVSDLFKSYAGIDEGEKKNSPFGIYKKVKGDKKANQMMDKWISAVDGSWSYLWELNTELSN
jgi:hypothetical protein